MRSFWIWYALRYPVELVDHVPYYPLSVATVLQFIAEHTCEETLLKRENYFGWQAQKTMTDIVVNSKGENTPKKIRICQARHGAFETVHPAPVLCLTVGRSSPLFSERKPVH